MLSNPTGYKLENDLALRMVDKRGHGSLLQKEIVGFVEQDINNIHDAIHLASFEVKKKDE